jgi:hypothetical protein
MPIVRMNAAEARKHRTTPTQRARLLAMTDEEITAAASSDPDNPPLTDAEIERFRILRAAKVKQLGGPPMQEADRKVQTTLRLPPEVLAYFRSLVQADPYWRNPCRPCQTPEGKEEKGDLKMTCQIYRQFAADGSLLYVGRHDRTSQNWALGASAVHPCAERLLRFCSTARSHSTISSRLRIGRNERCEANQIPAPCNCCSNS